MFAVPLLAVALAAPPGKAETLPGFRRSAWFREQVREEWLPGGVRVLANAADRFDPRRPTRLVVYATPNGNSVEQTLGSAAPAGTDWHFDIQHAAAQVRRLREMTSDANIVLACAEADGLSWPAWRKRYPDDAPARVRKVVETVRGFLPAGDIRVTLAGHSGGGSFLFAYLDAADAVADHVEGFAFLDANYSYSDDAKHGDKLLAWLRGGASRRLTVLAYDDRNVTLNGKPVVGPTGGTFRATRRMLDRLGKDIKFDESRSETFDSFRGLGGRIAIHVHPNPANKILHTALVGEMNGLLESLAPGGTWGTFGGPRAYMKWVQPAAAIPPRPADAPGGTAVFKRIAEMPAADREEAIAAELLRGNVPEFLRTFHPITVRAKDAAGKEHTATVEVAADYLAVGSDADFVRVPLTPATAQRIVDAFGCALPTRKVVDDVYRAAAEKLAPIPLTENRESAAAFARHNELIEGQRAGRKPGPLVAGVKKDIVVTNRLTEKPNRVAIYGWHKPDGSPIQPLSIVHRDTYVDYSHGVRLLKRAVTADGRARDVRHVQYSPELAPLLSDEGPVTRPSY